MEDQPNDPNLSFEVEGQLITPANTHIYTWDNPNWNYVSVIHDDDQEEYIWLFDEDVIEMLVECEFPTTRGDPGERPNKSMRRYIEMLRKADRQQKEREKKQLAEVSQSTKIDNIVGWAALNLDEEIEEFYKNL